VSRCRFLTLRGDSRRFGWCFEQAMKTLHLSSLGALGLLLLGCGTTIAPSGTVTTTTRDVSAFRRISIGSGFVAHASAGTRALSIRTSDNLQDLVDTTVSGETLRVQLKPMTSVLGTATLEATITNDLLEGVEGSGAATITATATPTTAFRVTSSGASKVTVDGISCTTVTVDASGDSTATLSGAATGGTATASGASTVDLKGVPLTTLQADVSGASTIKARVSATLNGSASGASQIIITGSPANSVQTSGASSVQLNAP
jgi:hypothetical protein